MERMRSPDMRREHMWNTGGVRSGTHDMEHMTSQTSNGDPLSKQTMACLKKKKLTNQPQIQAHTETHEHIFST